MLKHRIVLFFVFLVVFSATFSIGATVDVPEDEAKAFLEEFEKMIAEIQNENFGVQIFLHNTQLALPMFIPGFGVAWGIFSAYSTGFAFSALSTTIDPLLTKIPPIAMIFSTPFGIMELGAYALAMSRSCILIIHIIKKTPIRPQWKTIILEIGIMAVLLFAGGIIEAYMIQTFSESTPEIKWKRE